MSSIETSGTSLPLTGPVDTADYFGMTLRDYFAANALVNSHANSGTARDAARWAYEIADAMLKAREA